ncbi:MAG: arylesterase [Alphaproteobacteria bacterium]|nr:MAG: arylesterase [Alphaproteobacteria bacterium]
MVTGLINTFRLAFVLLWLCGPVAAGGNVTVLAFGDSLTAGYGLGAGEALPDQLEQALKDRGIGARVINAGVSGDTTAGGLARLEWTLAGLDSPPDLVILALGANDALRGIAPALTRANLAAMIEALQARAIPVLLAGMVAPPNMGPDYAAEFNPIYPELAARYGVALYPFLLDGVAANPALNQEDGMHPNGEGVAVIAERLAPIVARALSETDR